MSGWTLFLDDERFPAQGGDELQVCRTSMEAISLMRERGCPSLMLLDHDLGPQDDATAIFYPAFEELVLDRVITIPEQFEVHIHSMNSVGGPYLRGKIESLVGEMRRRAAASAIPN